MQERQQTDPTLPFRILRERAALTLLEDASALREESETPLFLVRWMSTVYQSSQTHEECRSDGSQPWHWRGQST